MTKSRWKKIEKGWYQLEGTPFSVCNMRGQAARYTGPTTPCWEVRQWGKVIDRVFTMDLAKKSAERVLDLEQRKKEVTLDVVEFGGKR